MIIVLSPAKTLDYRTPPTLAEHSQPAFLEQSQVLIDILRELSPAQIASLMKISDQLAVLNATRYAEWARAVHAGQRQAGGPGLQRRCL
jgi:cytoplasmic iron level regulating protein YaaA (DUF328/UPF0246 family)